MSDMGRRILRALLSRVEGIREGALFLWLFVSRPAAAGRYGAMRERGLGGGFPTLPTACGSG